MSESPFEFLTLMISTSLIESAKEDTGVRDAIIELIKADAAQAIREKIDA